MSRRNLFLVLILSLVVQSLALSTATADTQPQLFKCNTKLEKVVVGVLCIDTNNKRAFSIIIAPIKTGGYGSVCSVAIDGHLKSVSCDTIDAYLQ